MMDPDRIRFHRGITHPATLVGVDGEDEGLEKESTIKWDSVRVNLLRCIRGRRCPRDGKIFEKARSARRLERETGTSYL